MKLSVFAACSCKAETVAGNCQLMTTLLKPFHVQRDISLQGLTEELLIGKIMQFVVCVDINVHNMLYRRN